MKQAVLVHNPTAGDGNHEKQELKKMIEDAGYEVNYYSTKSLFWKHFTHEDVDVIFVAGGDGTVQKLSKAMLEAKQKKILQVPVQVLPFGTANNIARTLEIAHAGEVLGRQSREVGFDIGVVEGVDEETFFIEGIGCGIFPQLVKVMEVKEEEEKRDEIQQSLKELLKLLKTYRAGEAVIVADKEEITGKFLLVELLNIKYIGPNFELAPNAATGDGYFELVIVREDAREELFDFVRATLDGRSVSKEIADFAEVRKVKNVRLKWMDKDLHVDDEIIENYEGGEIDIRNKKEVFKFLRP